jgi:hypothetical protein
VANKGLSVTLEFKALVEDKLVKVMLVKVMLADKLVKVILIKVILVADNKLVVNSRFVDFRSSGSQTISRVLSTPIAKINKGKLNSVPQLKKDLKIDLINPLPHPVRIGSVGSPLSPLIIRP